MSIPAAATRFFAEVRELLIRAGGNPQMDWVDDWERSFEAVWASGESIEQLDGDLAVMAERTSILERHDKLVKRAEARMALRAAEAKRGLS
jgi:hypothetical protein